MALRRAASAPDLRAAGRVRFGCFGGLCDSNGAPPDPHSSPPVCDVRHVPGVPFRGAGVVRGATKRYGRRPDGPRIGRGLACRPSMPSHVPCAGLLRSVPDRPCRALRLAAAPATAALCRRHPAAGAELPGIPSDQRLEQAGRRAAGARRLRRADGVDRAWRLPAPRFQLDRRRQLRHPVQRRRRGCQEEERPLHLAERIGSRAVPHPAPAQDRGRQRPPHARWSIATPAYLYELFAARKTSTGWRAGSGAIWDMRSNALRPEGWTSADAAGLPILPGLARYDEVAAGEIRHALRFTAEVTRRAYIYPARHYASDYTDCVAAADGSAHPAQVVGRHLGFRAAGAGGASRRCRSTG